MDKWIDKLKETNGWTNWIDKLKETNGWTNELIKRRKLMDGQMNW